MACHFGHYLLVAFVGHFAGHADLVAGLTSLAEMVHIEGLVHYI